MLFEQNILLRTIQKSFLMFSTVDGSTLTSVKRGHQCISPSRSPELPPTLLLLTLPLIPVVLPIPSVPLSAAAETWGSTPGHVVCHKRGELVKQGTQWVQLVTESKASGRKLKWFSSYKPGLTSQSCRVAFKAVQWHCRALWRWGVVGQACSTQWLPCQPMSYNWLWRTDEIKCEY